MSRQIINVKGADGIIVGITLSPTGVLTRAALETAFANSLCLKYKNENFGFDQTTEQSYIIVNFDENVKAFIEPAGGWMGKTYEVVYRAKDLSLAGPFKSTKRNVPDFYEIEKYLYYIKEANGSKSCVVLLKPNYMVTFRHGPHSQYSIDDEVTIYTHNGFSQYKTNVKYLSRRFDFVILKSNKNVMTESPPMKLNPMLGTNIALIGYGNELECLSYRNGILHIQEKQTFRDDTDDFIGPFYLGNVSTNYGDSGAGVWSPDGLIGINLGFVGFPTYDQYTATDEAAHYSASNYFVGIRRIMDALKAMDPSLKKKPYFSMNLDG
uniref:Serine protease n=1 Tax=Meloidogyne incognita TaxID=6306 RepID=A0A914KUV4_MELIC